MKVSQNSPSTTLDSQLFNFDDKLGNLPINLFLQMFMSGNIEANPTTGDASVVKSQNQPESSDPSDATATNPTMDVSTLMGLLQLNNVTPVQPDPAPMTQAVTPKPEDAKKNVNPNVSLTDKPKTTTVTTPMLSVQHQLPQTEELPTNTASALPQPKLNNMTNTRATVDEKKIAAATNKSDVIDTNSTNLIDQIDNATNLSSVVAKPTPIEHDKTPSNLIPDKITNAFSQIGLLVAHGLRLSSSASPANPSQQPDIASAQTMPNVAHDDIRSYFEFQPQRSIDGMNHLAYDAKINIYPPELGHVAAKLKLNKNTAELTLTASSDRVKEILEANIAQLKQHFSQNDINLTNVRVDVSLSDGGKGSHSAKQSYTDTPQLNNQANHSSTTAENDPKTIKSDSLVDTYA